MRSGIWFYMTFVQKVMLKTRCSVFDFLTEHLNHLFHINLFHWPPDLCVFLFDRKKIGKGVN